MTCTTNETCYQWTEQTPIPFDQWKSLLAKLTRNNDRKQC